MVVVEQLTKTARFIPVMSSYSAEEYARIVLDEIVCRHGISISIIFDRGTQFTSIFWKSFQRGLGTTVKLSTDFHPQMDGQEERMIKPLNICLGRALLILKGVGIGIYLLWSFPTTIVFIHQFPWLPMKVCMVRGVGFLLDCLKWVSHLLLVLS